MLSYAKKTGTSETGCPLILKLSFESSTQKKPSIRISGSASPAFLARRFESNEIFRWGIIEQASRYGKSLGLDIITLVAFLETPMPEEIKQKYENVFTYENSASVRIVFLLTG